MRAKDRKIRNSLKYKIEMWLYRLTFKDIEKGIKIIFSNTVEIIALILGFFLIFLLPAFFH